jgi:ankyrin repeat protein
MPERHVPVHPDLDQLRHQAKDLLKAIRRGEPAALGELERNHPGRPDPATARLADAQLALARSYGVASWPRLVRACRIIDAIWEDDVETVRALVTRHPALLHEDARGVPGNWGPPMSYAANLGRGRIIAMLRERGATDLQFAFDRACLQGQLDAARQLHAMGARPAPDALMGPAETQSAEGMAFLFGLGAAMGDGQGNSLAPVAMVLETYGRHPEGKHACLELFAGRGVALPDTPAMAVHRGRQDLLEAHLRRDPDLFTRTFAHHDIYPSALGCHADPTQALHATPLDGTTLLHLCVDNDELELVRWMLDRGAGPDARAAVDRDGFGGHTALFGCVVSQPYRNGRRGTALAQLLLDRGADPNVRASLRKALRGVADETLHEYRDVTPLGWGAAFHDQDFVNPAVMALVAARGGQR